MEPIEHGEVKLGDFSMEFYVNGRLTQSSHSKMLIKLTSNIIPIDVWLA